MKQHYITPEAECLWQTVTDVLTASVNPADPFENDVDWDI